MVITCHTQVDAVPALLQPQTIFSNPREARVGGSFSHMLILVSFGGVALCYGCAKSRLGRNGFLFPCSGRPFSQPQDLLLLPVSHCWGPRHTVFTTFRRTSNALSSSKLPYNGCRGAIMQGSDHRLHLNLPTASHANFDQGPKVLTASTSATTFPSFGRSKVIMETGPLQHHLSQITDTMWPAIAPITGSIILPQSLVCTPASQSGVGGILIA